MSGSTRDPELLSEDASELRRRDIELRRSETRLRTTLASIGDGVISTDAQGRVELLNPVAEALTGWSAAEAKGRPITEVFRITNEEARVEGENPVARVLREGVVVGLANHTLLIDKNGAERPISDSGAPIHDEAGQITGAVLVFRDQTDERLAQKRLEETETRFRTFFDNAPIGKSMTGPDGTLLRVNRTFGEMLGYSLEEMQSIAFAEITHPDDIAESKECVRCLLAGERDSWVMEKRYLHKAGHPIWTHVTTSLQRDDANRPLHFLTHILDIDGRKRSEDALREANNTLEQRVLDRTQELAKSKQLLEETGRLARVGGWEMDLLKNELIWTDVVRQIHEVEPGFQPQLDTAINFYAPEAVPVISEAVRCAIEEGKTYDVELQLITAKERRLWVRAVGGPVREDGKIVKVRGVFQDIDERKLAEIELRMHRDHLETLVEERTEALEEAVSSLELSNHELEQFAYVASHDLQEPLRMVASFTQLLSERYKGQLDEKADSYIGFAVDGARRMQGLINNLLAYSRVGSRAKPIEPVQSSEVVAEALLGLQQLIAEHHADIRVGLLPAVLADRFQLGQAVQNLIGNAVKFCGDRTPVVEISAQREGLQWVFEVKDNGIGIDPEYFERIFVIFQRLHERDAYPGNGMGLAIVKKIIERHGGRIWVESEPGLGSRFLFTLRDAQDGRDEV